MTDVPLVRIQRIIPASPSLSFARGTLRLLSRISTRAASRVAVELFRTPRRFTSPERETQLLSDASAFEVRLGTSTRIRAWRWGQTGPMILLAHGWEGRGSQLAVYARPLVAAGFRVVTFDAPGHGASGGRHSSLPEFTWALRGVAETIGAPHAIIAHSFGCAAATLALRDGLTTPRLVFIAPPLDPSDYTQQFGEMFGLDEAAVDGLRKLIEERFLRKWDDYSLATTAPKMTSRLLIVHDRDDEETRWSGGARLAELWPGARLMSTEGLGHRRVLREPAVVDAVVRFVTSE